MKDFHTVQVWKRFPAPWPPPERARVSRLPHNDGAIEVWAHPDGHMEVVAIPSTGADSATMHFQRVQTPDRPTAALMEVTNAAGVLGLALNTTSLKSLSEAGEIPYVLPFSEPPVPERSIDHPDARTACVAWISERQSRFSKKKPFVKRGRKSLKKTTSQQVDDLRQSTLILRDSIQLVATGAKHHVPAIAGVLRALLYWPNDTPTWNPLLLRVANVKQLPLPVFGFPPELVPGLPTDGLILRVENVAPSITREFPGQALMDLEAYLGLQLLMATREGGETSTLSVGETLGSIASSQGTSHYDETIDLDIERLNGIVTVRTNVTERVLDGVGRVVAELADHVVSKLGD